MSPDDSAMWSNCRNYDATHCERHDTDADQCSGEVKAHHVEVEGWITHDRVLCDYHRGTSRSIWMVYTEQQAKAEPPPLLVSLFGAEPVVSRAYSMPQVFDECDYDDAINTFEVSCIRSATDTAPSRVRMVKVDLVPNAVGEVGFLDYLTDRLPGIEATTSHRVALFNL